MKKLSASLLLCLALLLAACDGDLVITGELLYAHTDESTENVLYTIYTAEGKSFLVTLAEHGSLHEWPEAVEENALYSGELSGTFVTAYCDRVQTPVSLPDGESARAYSASVIMVDALQFDNAAFLADGTPLRITQYRFDARTRYSLTDGTELLIEGQPTRPENVYVGGVESFDDLTPAAQEKVRAYYENQGLLYDIEEILERAYAACLTHDSEENFNSLFVEQSIAPTASSEQIMYFTTVVARPLSGGYMYEERLSAAFDRKTGEYISTFDLFTCAENEILPHLLDLAKITDETLRAEMAAVFAPENIIFLPDHIELWFTQGTLPSEPYSFGFSLSYDDALRSLLAEHAIPKSNN